MEAIENLVGETEQTEEVQQNLAITIRELTALELSLVGGGTISAVFG
jgi:hypothetical protein